MLPKASQLLGDILEESQKHIEQIESYLEHRKLDHAIVKKFQLGYLPSIDTIFEALEKKNWSAEEALELAVNLRILFKNEKDKYSSLLSGRLIFPIFDTYGRIIALSGRVIHDNQKPKYFNTVFQKGKNLYGLNFACKEILQKNFVIVVEGYMDVIASHRVQIENIVAVMGTAFRTEHAILLARYANQGFLLLDDDEAGRRSTERCMKKQIDPLIIKIAPKNLPGKTKDLDEFINQNPKQAKKFLTQEILK